MTEYISREAAINAVGEAIADGRSWYDALINALAADVVPVVRCKDCKYAIMTYDGDCKYCRYWADRHEDNQTELYLSPDFYCAAGERRE